MLTNRTCSCLIGLAVDSLVEQFVLISQFGSFPPFTHSSNCLVLLDRKKAMHKKNLYFVKIITTLLFTDATITNARSKFLHSLVGVPLNNLPVSD